MPVVKNYHNCVEVQTNVAIENPFSRRLQGWKHLGDAFNFKDIEIDKLENHQKWIIDYADNPDDFNVNSDCYRSDEFTNNHNGKHILFSGCSVTYGQGLYTKELWSYKVYKLIKEKEKVSGYYNLGTPGTSIMDIVVNIFKYIDLYGNPDVIFIDLPDLTRFYSLQNYKKFKYIEGEHHWEFWDKDKYDSEPDQLNNFTYYNTTCKENVLPNIIMDEFKIYYYQYLLMLEIYCKNNNIDLFLFSYVNETYEFLLNTDINNLYNINKNINELVYEYHVNNPDDMFYLKARDNSHPGTAFHHSWAELMYNYYKEENYDD